MIVYAATYPYSVTMGKFLRNWGHRLRRAVRFVYYEDLPRMARLPRGAWIFSDLERLGPAALDRAVRVADRVAREGCPVLNRPDRVLGRLALSEALSEAGVNDFRSYPLAAAARARLPVFLRLENQHEGAMTPLLRTPEEVAAAAARAGAGRSAVLAVEFSDTVSPDGLYRKYSVFRVGDRFVPRHVLFGRNWVTKYPDVVTPATVAEEWDYVRADPTPHEAEVRAAFDLAGCQYGRIDYGVRDGRVRVWEININPTITLPPARLHPPRRELQAWVAGRLCAALDALPAGPPGGRSGPIPIDPGFRAELGSGPAARWLLPPRQVTRSVVWSLPGPARGLFRRLGLG